MSNNIYQFEAELNNGELTSLEKWRGNVMLVVNTASACGFTPQYQGLEKLQQQFSEQGFTVLAFPCNQFGKQEKGSDEEVRNFCDLNFNISFPLFKKIDVNGSDELPLYGWLKKQKGGLLGDRIKWNFTKFLVSADGKVVRRYAPTTKPEQIAGDITAQLS
ncbi:glutathione peroxidase [Ferrimonas lipolytica]|uniref:Glutathione peroxidase n=1 Tax=Ferrimonas lipolytica TaxID=2724191 RepID=A0A6H1UE08_9GAMM|nr:glutathione peroxidase [Ferrimonas lipolytica]QIZ76573.1 glutathione peroxidase [Ferrimonas lipolytica]